MRVAEGNARTRFMEHFRVPAGEAGLEMLRLIVARFAEIPYENITKIIRKFTVDDPLRRLRGPMEVIDGYLDHRTGGTCFSLTYCLGSILAGCGFACRPMMADMRRPNVHCALAVEIGGRGYLVDPGYLLAEPVELSGGPVRVATPFGGVELRPRGGDRYDLFTVTAVERRWRYTLKTDRVPPALFVRYWQESFSLPMMNSLQLTKLAPGGHLYIRDHHLRFGTKDAKTNENIRSSLEVRIEAEFGIPGGLTAQAREYLERMKGAWRTRERAGR